MTDQEGASGLFTLEPYRVIPHHRLPSGVSGSAARGVVDRDPDLAQFAFEQGGVEAVAGKPGGLVDHDRVEARGAPVAGLGRRAVQPGRSALAPDSWSVNSHVTSPSSSAPPRRCTMALSSLGSWIRVLLRLLEPETFTGLTHWPHAATFRAEDAAGNQDAICDQHLHRDTTAYKAKHWQGQSQGLPKPRRASKPPRKVRVSFR